MHTCIHLIKNYRPGTFICTRNATTTFAKFQVVASDMFFVTDIHTELTFVHGSIVLFGCVDSLRYQILNSTPGAVGGPADNTGDPRRQPVPDCCHDRSEHLGDC